MVTRSSALASAATTSRPVHHGSIEIAKTERPTQHRRDTATVPPGGSPVCRPSAAPAAPPSRSVLVDASIIGGSPRLKPHCDAGQHGPRYLRQNEPFNNDPAASGCRSSKRFQPQPRTPGRALGTTPPARPRSCIPAPPETRGHPRAESPRPGSRSWEDPTGKRGRTAVPGSRLRCPPRSGPRISTNGGRASTRTRL